MKNQKIFSHKRRSTLEAQGGFLILAEKLYTPSFAKRKRESTTDNRFFRVDKIINKPPLSQSKKKE